MPLSTKHEGVILHSDCSQGVILHSDCSLALLEDLLLTLDVFEKQLDKLD